MVLPKWLSCWFALDLLLALLPPLHWAAGGAEPILGVPRILLYLLGTGAVVAASAVAAYIATRARP